MHALVYGVDLPGQQKDPRMLVTHAARKGQTRLSASVVLRLTKQVPVVSSVSMWTELFWNQAGIPAAVSSVLRKSHVRCDSSTGCARGSLP